MSGEDPEPSHRVRQFQRSFARVGIMKTFGRLVQIRVNRGFDPDLLPITAVCEVQVRRVQVDIFPGAGQVEVSPGRKLEPEAGYPRRRLEHWPVAKDDSAPEVLRVEIGFQAKADFVVVCAPLAKFL